LKKDRARRNQTIDFLRVLAISYIVGIHHLDDYASNYFSSNFDTVLTYIFLGTFVFISGCLLGKKYPSFTHKNEIYRFVIKRFLRIYPLYILALSLFPIFVPISLNSFILHIFLLNMFWGKSIHTLWFVSMICFYYLLFPIFVYKYNLLKTVFITIAICATLLGLNLCYDLIDLRLAFYLPFFVFGVIYSNNKRISSLLINRRFVIFSGAICYLSILLYSQYNESDIKYLLQITYMIGAISPLLFWGGRLVSHFNHYMIKEFSHASYCMYLFHRIIYFSLLKIYDPKIDTYNIIYLTVLGLPLLYYVSKRVQIIYDNIYLKIVS